MRLNAKKEHETRNFSPGHDWEESIEVDVAHLLRVLHLTYHLKSKIGKKKNCERNFCLLKLTFAGAVAKGSYYGAHLQRLSFG